MPGTGLIVKDKIITVVVLAGNCSGHFSEFLLWEDSSLGDFSSCVISSFLNNQGFREIFFLGNYYCQVNY